MPAREVRNGRLLLDHVRYRGLEDSGLDRVGLRYAMEEMTEIRIILLAQPM